MMMMMILMMASDDNYMSKNQSTIRWFRRSLNWKFFRIASKETRKWKENARPIGFELKRRRREKILWRWRKNLYFWQFSVKLLLFGDTVFHFAEVELILWFHYLHSLWELGHRWKRWSRQTERKFERKPNRKPNWEGFLNFCLALRNGIKALRFYHKINSTPIYGTTLM